MELSSSIDTIIVPRARDIGAFEVRRALPALQRQMVGPFIFLDQMGPAVLAPGVGLDVRPHPHIGLATVTYLFEGEIMHRDTLGNAIAIKPGELNLMTAGKGIAHSERSGAEVRARGGAVFGLQSWIALAKKDEEQAPAFVHFPESALPTHEGEGKFLRVIAGSFAGVRSPVETSTATLYADITLTAAKADMTLDATYDERAVYLVSGQVEVDGTAFEAGRLLVLKPNAPVRVRAIEAGARFVVLGGEPMDGPRHIWWNFVSSSQERIEQAKADWQANRFGLVPGDSDERIPLPA